MITKIIERYAQLQKQKMLDANKAYTNAYAFVGVGAHSMANLYPVLQHLRIQLNYICTRNIDNAKKMATQFSHCVAVNDLSIICNDPKIKGVFVCAQTTAHFSIVSQLLQAGKHVFVEKPVCSSSTELQMLMKQQGELICLVGLQKRFGTIGQLLQKHAKQLISYNGKYLLGSYGGNPILDLFIHPIDNVVQVFGEAKLQHAEKVISNNDVTFQLTLQHANAVSGMLELSTAHSWQAGVDELIVNTKKEIFHCQYPNKIWGIQKQSTVLGVPLEKALPKPVEHKIYFDACSPAPIRENNSLLVQGFYGELKTFVDAVETGQQTVFGSLHSLTNTYSILDALAKL
jgi:virulence factor